MYGTYGYMYHECEWVGAGLPCYFRKSRSGVYGVWVYGYMVYGCVVDGYDIERYAGFRTRYKMFIIPDDILWGYPRMVPPYQ